MGGQRRTKGTKMIYVDPLFNTEGWSKNWPFKQASHMFSDNLGELHTFALKLGLKRSWFQAKRNFPHYDLTLSKRKQAVRRGAKEVDREFMVKKLRNKNEKTKN